MMEGAEFSGGLATSAGGAPRGVMVSNASALFVAQGIGLLAPLLTVPYLARVLQPAAWGPVLMAQSLANWLVVVLEFAFDLSGTRAVARSRLAPESTSDVVRAVQSAKILLVLIAVPAALVIVWALPTLRHSPALILATLSFAVFRGLSPLWYFQGLERMRGAVAIETSSRMCAALGVFLVVQSPGDGWRVLALQAVFAALALGWLTLRVSREVALEKPSFVEGWRMLRESFALFAVRASAGVYAQANALIVGAIAPAAVGYFGGAERIVRAAINLLQPMTQAVLPRITYLRHSDPAAADRMVRRSFLVMGGIGATFSLVAFVAAPLLVRLLLGSAYEAAVPILRAMAVLPFLVSLTGVLGIFWAVPSGHERGLLKAALAAGATNLLLAVLLVPRYGSVGMAIAAVAAETVVLGVLMSLYSRR